MLDSIARPMIACLSWVNKDIYFNVYGFRQNDPRDELELPREKIGWLAPVYSATDIVVNNLKKTSAKELLDVPMEFVTDFVVFAKGLMSGQLNKELQLKWLRVLFGLFELPRSVLRHWMTRIAYKIEDTKDCRRLFRLTEETSSLPFLKVLTSVFNSFRALDLDEHFSKHYLAKLKDLFEVFEYNEYGMVSKDDGQESTCKYMIGETVTIFLNSKSN